MPERKRTHSKKESERFPCSRCGAMLAYAPGTEKLVCEYCGQENLIENVNEEILEVDFYRALRELSKARPVIESRETQCEVCGAHFQFEQSVHAGKCPFCGTSIVTAIAQRRLIKPKSLLPFSIDETRARRQFRMWIKSLWFSPGALKKYARGDKKLTGVYLPYWTYDSSTQTTYTGARGDLYYINQPVQYMQKGRMVTRVRKVPKIRWTPVRGRVARFFDDVLIGASRSLPRQILDRLQPWDLENLVPYNESYLSGFRSEVYQIALNEGFDQAKRVMSTVIYQDIAFDIGGNQQRIHHVRTGHTDTTYKHCLLPVWSAAFLYRDRSYQFIINGRTGQVQGDRPYSIWKITFAVLLGLAVLAGTVFFLDQSGFLQDVRWTHYG